MRRAPGALLLVAHVVACAPTGASPGWHWGVQPPTVKLALHATPPSETGSASVDLAAQLGECEAQQVWVRSASGGLSDVSLRPGPLTHSGDGSSVVAASHWRWLQQLYVNCSAHNTTTMYEPSAPGWHPDPLLQTEAVGEVPAGLTQPLWLELCVPYSAAPGTYRGNFSLLVGDDETPLPVKVEVWPIAIRNTSDPAAFWTMFSFNQAPLTQYESAYPGLGTPWLSTSRPMMDWLSLLQQHRTPADSIYYPDANYQVQGPSTWCAATRCRRSTGQIKAFFQLGGKRLNINDLASGTENLTETFLAEIVEAANISVTQLVAALGAPSVDAALERAYVYSFDELPEAKIDAIYKIFGAIKHAYPKLRTVATLPDGRKFGRTDWTRLPADLPVDVWVDAYAQDYDAEKIAAVRAWTAGRNAAGQPHEYVWYWAIGPHKEPWPNTFVERAAIEARLLFWLCSLHGVRGMVNIKHMPCKRPFHQTKCWRCNSFTTTWLTF